MEKRFSIEQAISFGFSSFVSNVGLFAQVFSVFVLILASAASIIVFWDPFDLLEHPPSVTKMIVIALTFVLPLAYIVYALRLGLRRIYLDIYDTGSSSLPRLFSCFYLVPKVALAEFLYALLIMFGFIALIIPGFFVITFLGFAGLILIDRGGKIGDAFNYSYHLVRGAGVQVFLFLLLYFLIQLPLALLRGLLERGMISGIFGVGIALLVLLLTVVVRPSLSLAEVYIYRKLQEQSK